MNRKAVKSETLPEGWREEKLGDVATFKTGKLNSNEENAGGIYPFFTCSLETLKINRYAFEEEALLLAGNNANGVFSLKYYKGKFNAYQRTYIINIDIKHNDYKFFFYVLRQQLAYLENTSYGTTTKYLTLLILNNIAICIPSLPEQKAIASLLETWDTAIEKTEALIAAKQKQFKWLLKTLISDQQDNPKWKERTLREIGEISSAGVDKKIIKGEQDVRLVNYLDVYRRDKIYSNELNHHVTAPISKASKCSVQKGDIFFTPSSEVRDDIGCSAVAMEDIPDAVYSYHIVRLRPQIKIDLLYRAFALKGSSFYRQATTFADGSGQRYVISQSSFRKIKVSLPPISEQRHIAETLNTTQREITLLNQLSKKYHTQKRGLMQKLLTGEHRIVTNQTGHQNG